MLRAPTIFAHACLLTLALVSIACRAEQPEPASAQPSASGSGPAPADARAPSPTGTVAAAPDPEREAKLADLDDMCKALNRDYGDGTLGDYYAKLQPRTAWGKQQIAAGNETIKPGRLLEQAIAELAPEALPEACQKLLDYLDEVE